MPCSVPGGVLIDFGILIVFSRSALARPCPSWRVIASRLVVDARREIRMLTARLAGGGSQHSRVFAQVTAANPLPPIFRPRRKPEPDAALPGQPPALASPEDGDRQEASPVPSEPPSRSALRFEVMPPRAGTHSRPRHYAERLGPRWAVGSAGLALWSGTASSLPCASPLEARRLLGLRCTRRGLGASTICD